MRRRRFAQVDVFASRPTKGNGLAVVLDAGDLSAEEMQGFAAWTNLAETTFLRPPGDASADYAVRIFTPAREMPFAGHPTLGSCAAWLDAGGVPRSEGRVVQECAIGLVDIHLDGDVPAFVAPETEVAALSEDEVASLCDALAVSRRDVVRAARLANGPVWQILELARAEAVLAVDAARVRWPEHVGVSVLGAHPEGAECDYRGRRVRLRGPQPVAVERHERGPDHGLAQRGNRRVDGVGRPADPQPHDRPRHEARPRGPRVRAPRG